jgi:hypothetical protein
MRAVPTKQDWEWSIKLLKILVMIAAKDQLGGISGLFQSSVKAYDENDLTSWWYSTEPGVTLCYVLTTRDSKVFVLLVELFGNLANCPGYVWDLIIEKVMTSSHQGVPPAPPPVPPPDCGRF